MVGWGRRGVTPARVVIVAILAASLGLGVLMWWLQTRAYYQTLDFEAAGPVTAVRADTGATEELEVTAFRAIDSASSPIRFRSCFVTGLDGEAFAARYAPYPEPMPLNAPGWFDCFDAPAVGDALAAGEARAYLSAPDVRYGVDRVLAIQADGNGVGWNQLNRCGEAVFNGRPPPEGCPPPPDGARLNYAPE